MLYGEVLETYTEMLTVVKRYCVELYDSCTLKTHRNCERLEFRLQIGILKLFT